MGFLLQDCKPFASGLEKNSLRLIYDQCKIQCFNSHSVMSFY